MTATVENVLHVAHSQLGYEEKGGSSGHNGNVTKYWAELDPGLQGQPWCACFQRWVNKHAKAPDLPVSNPYYCPNLVIYAKQHKLWDGDGHYQPGDLVFFDFTGHGVAEHIGRVVKDDGKVITTIEGNTLPESGGNQADGGGVYLKHRPHGSTVMGVLKYSTLLAHSANNHGHAPSNAVKHNPYPKPHGILKHGDHGDGVRWVQWAVGVPIDGQFGPQTEHAVREFQRYHHACGRVDGEVGPKTIAVLSRVTHHMH